MPEQDTPPGETPIQGVFSTMETRKVGTGATQRKTKVKQYWLVRQLDDDLAEVQPINEKLIPVGKKRNVPIGTLLERFSPEPDFYITPTGGEQPPEEIATGPSDSQLDLDDGPLPEPATLPGLQVEIEGFDLSGTPDEVEKNARASFGLGLMYLKRGNHEKAEEIFTKLAEMDAAFAPVHKHMFNDFGISLRKQRLTDTALKHYLRGLELADDDENLLHNIARAYFEKKDIKNCVKYLERSLEVNPNLKESQLFLKFIRKREGGGEGKRSGSSKPIVMDF